LSPFQGLASILIDLCVVGAQGNLVIWLLLAQPGRIVSVIQ
jgi:hypothetical protein